MGSLGQGEAMGVVGKGGRGSLGQQGAWWGVTRAAWGHGGDVPGVVGQLLGQRGRTPAVMGGSLGAPRVSHWVQRGDSGKGSRGDGESGRESLGLAPRSLQDTGVR